MGSVHPRVCGEQAFPRFNSRRATGSSPRVRGTACPIAEAGATRRFIPACAGNSAVREICPSLSTVHPRVCGEQDSLGRYLFATDGSSPRVRGTALHALAHATNGRFIPACAGNSSRA